MWAINQSWGYTINYLRLYSLNYCISCGQKIKCCICNNWNVDICIFKLKRLSIIWVFVNLVLRRSATLFCHVIWYRQLLIGGYMYICTYAGPVVPGVYLIASVTETHPSSGRGLTPEVTWQLLTVGSTWRNNQPHVYISLKFILLH